MKALKKITEFLQDNQGQFSMMRLMILVVIITMIAFFRVFMLFVNKELTSEQVNYQGLTLLFSAMFINFLLAFAGKVIQKRYEKKQ